MKKTWREAATLIVVARDSSKNIKFDYKVLIFRRTDKTSMLPGHVCFPGGTIDKTDETKDWEKFLKDRQIPFEKLKPDPGAKKPLIFDDVEGKLKRDISLRLTAIRETFEELGIIICHNKDKDGTLTPFSTFYHTKSCDIPIWQCKIHDHQLSLLKFCENFNLTPDIMNIHEWSCWMTPTNFGRRFESVFFFAALNEIPPTYPETHEVQDFYVSKNGIIHVYPGDDLYPENPNYYKTNHDISKYDDKTVDELRAMTKSLSRTEQHGFFGVKTIANIPSTDGHIPLMKKPWREAATLMVIARDVAKNVKFDYKVLTFKRTEKSSFMPNGICFPGGAIDKNDEIKDWTRFFENHKIPIHDLRKKLEVKKPLIYNTVEGKLERELSLRITAIRETFEELGVIICRDPSKPSNSPFSSFYQSKDFDIVSWQKKIHDDEISLLSFCQKFNLMPDVMKIHEWSCWLTPTCFRPKRFETIFYLVALNDIPPILPECHEVQDYQWETPDEYLRLYKENQLWLPPPQFVEMRRLSTIKSIDKLVEIAKGRKDQEMETILPYQFKAKDGSIHVLPGDDLYPENPDFYECSYDINKYSDKTLEEMRSIAKNLLRAEQNDLHNVNLFSNITPKDGHIMIASD
ncbi:CLUMA_CG015795, isoform A [Clunio marinus]|uniref:CLUMA_CG015795, isoform A n=1 Tax=Clunio marinus TaxID=568069 RepID=A0A1J1ISI0_9DIPT|nr:CLUMA_CG015795, isoform A [Clunio marinus]